MSFSEQLDQLNRQLAARLETVAEELRHAYLERLRGAHESALRSLAEFAPALPTDLIPADTRAALAAAAAPPPPAPSKAADELLEALQRIDSARMQSDLLEALLEGARRFCSRSALLITAEEGTHGWAGSGFGGGLLALDDLSIAVEAGSPLAHLFDGQGVVALSPEECASLVGRYSDEAATEGLLVPIVLRDRIAAALYADRTGGAAPMDAAALQVLAYAAAQTLELLGLRERAVTPTLYRQGAAPLPPLALWSEAPGQPTEEEATPATPAELSGEAFAPAPSFEPAVEAAPVAAFAAAPEPTAAPAWELAPPSSDEGLFLPEEPVAAPAVAAPVTAAEPLSVEPVWTATEDDTAVSRVAIAEAGETWSEPVFELAPEEEEQVFELAMEEPPIEAAEASERPPIESVEPADQADQTHLILAVEPPAPAVEPPALFIAPPAIEEVTSPLPIAPAPWAAGPAATQRIAVVPSMPTRADLSEDETVMIPRSGMPAAAAVSSPFVTSPAPTPPAPSAPALAGGWPAGERTASGRGAEVLPPPDLQGPGWAFTASRTPVVAGDEALHEEARRLARLLVSEIKLYNEEQVEEGRRAKDIYSRLREDIDRSRQLYEERVHERVRANADYFQQELVRNLAGGDASALGR